MDNAFHRDSSTNAVIATAVNGRNTDPTASRPRSDAGVDTLAFSEGAGLATHQKALP